MELGGDWRLQQAEGDLHQRFVAPDFDDSGWVRAAVPGHWRSVPGLFRSDGPLLYRRPFEAKPPASGRRRFLVLEGVFYFGDVWLDGAYLGATEGYYTPHAFEVTEPLAHEVEHVLAVEVSCPREQDRAAKRMVTGVFSHWDALDPTWNPGGLWRPVRLLETGPVRLGQLRVLCTEATEDRGRLRMELTLDAVTGPTPVRLCARLRGPGVELDAVLDQTLAAGPNHLAWPLEVEHPPRWWPWRLGDQPLCDLEVAVEVDGERSDGRRLRTAFREIRNDHWRFHVNGERCFLMGSNQGPARMALAEASPEGLAADVAAAREANLDMLRLHAHVSRPEVYDAADEAGVLLWQDMPLQWSYARGVRKTAVSQARELVDLVGHHPSVALWCAHNEPFRPGGRSQLLPSWNKDVLDRSLDRALSRADPTRPVVSHSGVLPGPLRSGTDSHLYFGWYRGDMGDLAGLLRRWPRLARFVSEFGAQAVPDSADFMEPHRWPHLDWARLVGRHSLQKEIFDRRVPPADYERFDDWREATQAYQAALIQLQGEDLRRLKYRPTGGFLHFCFADAHPSVTWAVLDDQRRPKAGHAALRQVCRSVLPMLDPRTGSVHVASELRRPLAGADVTAKVGDRAWRWTGDIPPDSLTFVGRVEMPPQVSSAELTLTHPDLGVVINAYGPLVLAVGFSPGDGC
jgi:beta-mannosidase